MYSHRHNFYRRPTLIGSENIVMFSKVLPSTIIESKISIQSMWSV